MNISYVWFTRKSWHVSWSMLPSMCVYGLPPNCSPPDEDGGKCVGVLYVCRTLSQVNDKNLGVGGKLIRVCNHCATPALCKWVARRRESHQSTLSWEGLSHTPCTHLEVTPLNVACLGWFCPSLLVTDFNVLFGVLAVSTGNVGDHLLCVTL